ncbi:unnamed protein product [Fusarium graminearum]|uniref:Uncharacterized protein n=1 Tax=Gibberella zeae TaxID=5518 RepID=A0A9N8R9I8_GIBZA|nr:unnamed protein product [Fusarium graminearum]CAG1971605.1 unnamed protein product [Fusarium graminearum]CAG1988216.1 unnamed protein product [Fusarium graminearum]
MKLPSQIGPVNNSFVRTHVVNGGSMEIVIVTPNILSHSESVGVVACVKDSVVDKAISAVAGDPCTSPELVGEIVMR